MIGGLRGSAGRPRQGAGGSPGRASREARSPSRARVAPGLRACLASLVLTGALPASAPAQVPEPGGSRDETVAQQVRRLEQELERAVSRGVSVVERQLPTPVPGLLLFAGSIQARGFVLDDYGVFFYVEYPVVRRSLLWSLGVLHPFDAGTGPALASLRRRMLAMQDGPGRAALSRALREVEEQARPAPAAPVAAGAPAPPAARVDGAPAPLAVDPEELYRTALREALTDALMMHGGALPGTLGDFEWLTVAARDARAARVRAGERPTLQIRVRGGDLAALRDGRLSLEEARGRVETR